MNLKETHEFLVGLIRDGAGTIAALLVGLVVGFFMAVRFWGRHQRAKLAKLETLKPSTV
jgi:hypothetical protein